LIVVVNRPLHSEPFGYERNGDVTPVDLSYIFPQ
jgi:hypothetical protein